MQKLFRLTPLQDSFPCNFNILIAGMPRVMGVGEILDEWTGLGARTASSAGFSSRYRRRKTACTC